MTDHFAVFAQPRRPWLEPEVLKDAFHRTSASLHPDLPGTGDEGRFAALNAAYTVLREPLARIRHLLELISPASLANAAPPPGELADLFMHLAGLRRRVDQFLGQRKAASAPLMRALLAGDESALRRDLDGAVARLEAAHGSAVAALRALDSAWDESAPENGAALARLHDRFAYLKRWRSQIREAQFALAD